MAGRGWPASPGAFRRAVRAYLRGCAQGERLPTATGLALALGFPSRAALERAALGEERSTLLEWALSLVEEETLQAAFRKETAAGARFILQTSFGYGDKASREPGLITVRVEEEEGGA